MLMTGRGGNSESRQTPAATSFTARSGRRGVSRLAEDPALVVEHRLVPRSQATRVAGVLGELLELRDLALSLHAGRVVLRDDVDQLPDPVSDLEGKVGSGRAGERSDVVNGDPAVDAGGLLGLAHGRFRPSPVPSPPETVPPAPGPTSVSSASSSTSAWTVAPIADESPITH